MRKMTDPISEWTLKECINALKRMDADLLEYGYAIYIADRIHDLTRWIPVSERMPTEADYSEAGQIHLWDAEFGICRVYHKDIAHDFLKRIPLEFTHWKRITLPEGKP
jgi:hypothetical protein